MYNRYVPQSDGSYRRNSVPDPPAAQPPPEPASVPQQEHLPPKPAPHAHQPVQMGVGSFIKQILPSNFDTGDLIVVLLLLLMAADCQEDQNTALLTLALYLFL